MRISHAMPLQALIDLMGNAATDEEGAEMRRLLVESGYRYTDDYPEGAETWLYLGADDIDLDEV